MVVAVELLLLLLLAYFFFIHTLFVQVNHSDVHKIVCERRLRAEMCIIFHTTAIKMVCVCVFITNLEWDIRFLRKFVYFSLSNVSVNITSHWKWGWFWIKTHTQYIYNTLCVWIFCICFHLSKTKFSITEWIYCWK